ncbi:hypothetical protein JCGZ_02810 [Jatropha curcas]|uniref:CYP726A23 n=1 Tax=Jatropha curcas TaxID=180498 RepID=A0A067L1P6_JATCU|nr:uncharacterized protein LOC105629805 precursor [Jatropha curcas]AIM47553.1 CYP726A23 [Jatropha curcas]KDP42337.1 hypothetical protein JCGZ_02810 [Jatropha curcas]
MEHQILSFPALFSFLLFLLVLLKVSKKLYKHDSNPPPGPWKLPFLGNILQLAGDTFHRRLTELAKTHGPVMSINVGQIPYVVVSSPETAKEVMKIQDPVFADHPVVLAAEVILYSPYDIFFAPYGDHLKQMRKFCTVELLSTKRVQSFRSVREEEVADFVKFLRSKEGSSVNLTHTLFALTNSIVARTAVGHRSKNQEGLLKVIDEAVLASSGVNIADIFPSLQWLPSVKRERSRIWKTHRETDKILEDVLQEHRANRKAAVPKNGDQSQADNLLDVLLDLQESGNLDVPLPDAAIKGTIMEMFGAGSDTSSKTVEWAMAELMRNPEVMRKAQEELRSFFGENGEVEDAKIQELKCLKLIIKETLRLHPPGAVIPRLCRERTKVAGYDIYPNTKIFVNTWAIGRDPEIWSEAEKFNPDRFIDSSIDYKGNNFELIPFGAGRRICPGITLASANMELFLANLLYHFDWKFPQGITAENLDMNECFGGAVKRKVDLELIPIPFRT